MNDAHDPNTEAQVRAALGQRADETAVSTDALDNIRAARRSSPWARPIVYAAVAGVVAVLVGVAVFTQPDDSADPLDTAVDTAPSLPADEVVDPAPYPTAAPDPAPEATEPPDGPAEFNPQLVNSTGISSGQVRWHPLDVIASGLAITTQANEELFVADEYVARFAEDLGVTDPILRPAVVGMPEQTSNRAGEVRAFDVMQRTESGEVGARESFTVVAAQTEDGPWSVTHVLTQAFRIHTVEYNTAETIRVTGTGSAFEGTAILTVNGEETLLSVGANGFDDFSVVVARPQEDVPIHITVSSPVVIWDEVPNVASYVSWPIDSSTSLSVFSVAADDVLNVRSGPGTSNNIVSTLAADATGIAHTGEEEFVGSERWWEIQSDGDRGWVNSRFLVVNRDTDLTSGMDGRIWESILMEIPALDLSDMAPQVDFGGIGVYGDWATPWTTIAREDFEEIRNWSPQGTEDRSCECDMAVAEFLGFDTAKWDLGEFTFPIELDPESTQLGWSHGLTANFFDRFTTGSIYIPEPNPDESLDWRQYTVVFDFEDGTPLIRGIWRWGWTP
jgi:hypothetical protein